MKADTTGSLEAMKGALLGLPQKTIALRFLLSATGPVNVSDIDFARTSEALVIAFNVPVTEDAKAAAKSKGVDVKSYQVIYALLDDVRERMEGRIKSIMERVPRGKAKVKALFGRGKQQVAGCVVTEGFLEVKGFMQVFRGSEVVHEGPLTSLRRFKDNVPRVEEGIECGVGAGGFWQWQEGDKIEFFELVEKKLTLEESRASTAVDFETALETFEEEYQESLKAEEELRANARTDRGRGRFKFRR